jgi:tRNA A-37 threonylcarbamoyl transferase component Bud32
MKILDKKYIFIKPLGKGGFGEVFLYKEHLTNNLVAIKKLKRNPFFFSHDLIVDEIKVISQLNHPNVISYKHYFIEDNVVYFVMEYCSHGNLREIVANDKIGTTFIWKWMLELTQTLDYMHKKGIVHHDIKPENILFNNERIIKIADFGVANKSIGTKAYLPPEFFSKETNRNDIKLDIYALGLTLLEVLTKKNPFVNLTKCEIELLHVNQQFGTEKLSKWQQEIIQKAIHLNPAKRFQTMAEFHAAIQAKTVPYSIDKDVLQASKIAEEVKMLIRKKKWLRALNLLNFAKENYKPNINILATFGQYYLQINNRQLAKEYIEKALVWNPRLNLQKELAWLNLLERNYTVAISLLSDYLQRYPLDNEAQNLLLECYYKTKRYEIGREHAALLLEIHPQEVCFHVNYYFFKMHQLISDKSFLALEHVKNNKKTNPFLVYNEAIYSKFIKLNSEEQMKINVKYLFMDYRFNTYTPSIITIRTLENGIPTQEKTFEKPIISFGINHTFPADIFTGNKTDEYCHRTLIINFKDDIWLINLAYSSIFVNNEPVQDKIKIFNNTQIQIGKNHFEIILDKEALF